jgi:5-methylcytosine-specific restriction endonuclease McrA
MEGFNYIPLERTPSGKRKLRTSKLVKEEILKRDNYKCQMCFNKAELVHHVIPLWQNRELVNNRLNLMSLCQDCHKLAHGYKREK